MTAMRNASLASFSPRGHRGHGELARERKEVVFSSDRAFAAPQRLRCAGMEARRKDREATLQDLRQKPLGQLRLNKKADIQEPKVVDIDVGKQEGVSSSFEVSEPDSEDGIDEHKEIALPFDIVQLQ